jgi:predicted Zn-dependent protease
MLKEAKGPAEVAGVVAHEMGHIIKNHPAEALIREIGFSVISQLFFGHIGELCSFGQTLLMLKYSRESEIEADNVAINILHEKNINPNSFKAFFMRIDKKEKNNSHLLTYFSTHPSPADRISNMKTHLQKKPYNRILSKQEWHALQNICEN